MRPAPASDRAAAHIEFAGYLEAKFALDERSLNADVKQACIEQLAARSGVLRWLDVGTGTGAMVRRLLETRPPVPLEITALDQDAGLLNVASIALGARLESLGYHTRVHGTAIEADNSRHRVRVDFQCCGLFEFEPVESASYDLITAHSFMDVVPMARTLKRFSEWLARGGLLYATLNYDGDTALFPLYRNEGFEADVLAEYDASMERRRVHGEATGGARAGRRLHSLLPAAGFDVISYGSSDWNITPREGAYRDRDAGVLHALVGFICAEAERQPGIACDALQRWYAERSAQLESGELGMIIHQLDILAVYRKDLTALT